MEEDKITNQMQDEIIDEADSKNKNKSAKIRRKSIVSCHFSQQIKQSEEKYKVNSCMAVLCAIELMTNLIVKFKEMIDYLYSFGIRIEFLIIEDDFTFGYVGTDFTKLTQLIISNKQRLMKDYLVSI